MPQPLPSTFFPINCSFNIRTFEAVDSEVLRAYWNDPKSNNSTWRIWQHAVEYLFEIVCYKPGGRGFEIRWGHLISSIYLTLIAALGPGLYSTSDRNEYHKQEMLLGSRVRQARKAENLAAICEPIVYTMCDLRHLATLYVSTACYKDSFILLFYYGEC
jgi:hypothetical protein